ncbi:MAG: hypothetical protein JRG86_15010, partial [Deltaproteobacteria bacterium]|nr:hypothetical protein [Deltaproteobacteria bacterium]
LQLVDELRIQASAQEAQRLGRLYGETVTEAAGLLMAERFLEKYGQDDNRAFQQMARYTTRQYPLAGHALALMRLCKDVSHIVDAALNRGDRRRWHEIPRGLALIDRAAQRLTNSFPEIRELTCVIHALTQAARSADAESRGCSR